MSESAAIRDLRGRVALAHRLRAAGDLSPTNDSTGAFLERLLAEHDTLTAELAAARAEFAEWLDASRTALDAHAEVVAELAAAREERDEAQRNYAFMVERAANEKLDGYRELGARAAAAENDRDRLAACVERVRGVASGDQWFHFPGSVRAADILAALEGTDG